MDTPLYIDDLVSKRVWRPLKTFVIVVLAMLAVLAGLLGRSMSRAEPLHMELRHLNELQQSTLEVERALLGQLEGGPPVPQAAAANFKRAVDQVIGLGEIDSRETAVMLKQLSEGLGERREALRPELVDAVHTARNAIASEIVAHARVLEDAYRNTSRQYAIAVGLLVVALVGTVFLAVRVRDRVLRPLDHLSRSLTLVGQQEYRPVSYEGVSPMLQPVFASYNRLVQRLQELERLHAPKE